MAILRMTRKEYEAKYGTPAPTMTPQQAQPATPQQDPNAPAKITDGSFLDSVGRHFNGVVDKTGKVFNDAAGEITSLVTQPGKAAFDAYVAPKFYEAENTTNDQIQRNIDYAKSKGYKPGSAEYERYVSKPMRMLHGSQADVQNERTQARSDIDFTGLGNEDSMNLMQEGKYGQAFARSATGAPASFARATYAPLALPAEALIPGDGRISRVAKGALSGAMYGGPAGAVVGAASAFIPDALNAAKEAPGIKEYLAANPQAGKIFDDSLTLGLTVLAQKMSKKDVAGKHGDILNTPVSEVPNAIFHNLANTAMVPISAAGKLGEYAGKGMKWAGDKLNSSAYTPTADEARVVQNYNANIKFLRRELGKLDEGTAEYKNVSTQLKRLQDNPPITSSDTALREGLMGSEKGIGEQAKVESMDLWKNKVEPALKNSKVRISKDEIFSKLEERVAQETEPSRQAAMQNALDSLKEDYATKSDWNMLEANKLKSGLDDFTPPKLFKGQDVSSTVATLKNEMANTIREKIYSSIDDIDAKSAFRDYANLKELQKVGIKAMTSSTSKGGFGSFWSGLYDHATTPIKTVGGQTLYRVGNFLEFTGHEGIKTLGDYLDDIHVTVVPKDFANLPNKQGGFIKNPLATGEAPDIETAPSPSSSPANLHQQNEQVARQLRSDELRNTLKPMGDMVKGPINNYTNPIHKITQEVINSTVDMAPQYEGALVPGEALPLTLSDHIVGDISGKLSGVFQKPELAQKVSTALTGKTYQSLEAIQDAALKIILKDLSK
jgi:hypothetical protein